MKVVGCGTMKKVTALEPGEMCAVSRREGTWLALCVSKDNRSTELGLIDAGELSGRIVRLDTYIDCHSYGTEWILDVSISKIQAPCSINDGPNPRLLLDGESLLLGLTSGHFGDDTNYWDFSKRELAQRWPTTAVEFPSFQIWHDEASMERQNSRPLFVKK